MQLEATELIGRRAECAALEELVSAVRSGDSRALVVHGEPGVGKTALLDHLAVRAPGCRVMRAGGIQSEMELPFAGLHQLCGPLLDRLGRLPGPQADALRTAFGLRAGATPDRFLVGLAVLGLLSDAATERPLLCLIDDHQWLDRESAQALEFVARRLGAESVGVVMAIRVVEGGLGRLDELAVAGLRAADAGALLDTVLPPPVDVRVRDQIVAETRGNPLALLELPRGLTPRELAGGFGLPGAVPLSGSIEDNFSRRATALPEPARWLLLIAASEPTGDPALVWRAAEALGIEPDVASPVADTGLVEIDTRVRFRHPLARSAVYRTASLADRRRAHGALADATDPGFDPDRRAWHRAQASPGPDEVVAAELESCAGRAKARGGLAAAAAFLLRATTLTVDPALRAGRAIAAAQAHLQAGAFDATRDLIDLAEAGPLTDAQAAQVAVIKAQLAFVTSRGNEASSLLVEAARGLETIDPDRSRSIYLDALSAAIFAGRLARPGGDVLAVARAAGAAPPPRGRPRWLDRLLDGMAAGYNHGHAAGLPELRRILSRFTAEVPEEEQLPLLWLVASSVALRVWDDSAWDVLSALHVRLVQDTGALGEFPLAFTQRGALLLFRGELSAAAALTEQAQAVADAMGSRMVPYIALGLTALHGDEQAMADLFAATMHDATSRGEGVGITFAEWARTLLYNGLGRYDEAMSAGLNGVAYGADPGALIWASVELIEAAARAGNTAVAAREYRRFAAMTTASGTDWALGLQSRSKALLISGDEAEHCHREAIARLGRTGMRLDLARAHLLYGEWLRGSHRNGQAREQLRTAHTMLEAMGAVAFAERAGHELRATGQPIGKRVDAHRDDELTAQEARIAGMARDGLSNPEIASRLLISSQTVQYHLRKVFRKLGVTSRVQLDLALRQERGAAPYERQSGAW
ncbi:MAG TPA: AAA family ATPase [Pseudonocardiaceae bacterium]|nr:AAA family ATPase [Pseudonocardiaceae bacterium]